MPCSKAIPSKARLFRLCLGYNGLRNSPKCTAGRSQQSWLQTRPIIMAACTAETLKNKLHMKRVIALF